MLRIQRNAHGKTTFSLSGRMEAEDIGTLRRLIARESTPCNVVLNLKELLLVDSDAMEFLAVCEASKILLEQCPGFVRTWIEQWKNPERDAFSSPRPAPEDKATRTPHTLRGAPRKSGLSHV